MDILKFPVNTDVCLCCSSRRRVCMFMLDVGVVVFCMSLHAESLKQH